MARKRTNPSDLPAAWIRPRTKARLHILPAHKANKAVIIRRKPSKCFHVISWNTATDRIEHGSWFRGKLYPMRCDLSWDGEWMVYLAMGSNAQTWNGICEPPWLKTTVDVPNSLSVMVLPTLRDCTIWMSIYKQNYY